MSKEKYKYRVEVGDCSTYFATYDCAVTYFNAVLGADADVELWHIIYSFRPDGSVVGTQVLLSGHYPENIEGD